MLPDDHDAPLFDVPTITALSVMAGISLYHLARSAPAQRIAQAIKHGVTYVKNIPARLSAEDRAEGHISDIEQIRDLITHDGRGLCSPLGGIQLTEIDNIVFEQLAAQYPDLRAFQLCQAGLTHLPESIGRLSQLQYLRLKLNELVDIPEGIGNLSQLQILDLSGDCFGHNRLTYLPESIGNLSQLRKLDLRFNLLMHLPSCIDRLPQLLHLLLDENLFLARSDWPARALALEQEHPQLNLQAMLPCSVRPPRTTVTHISSIVFQQPDSRRAALRYNLATHTLDLSNTPIETIDPVVFTQIADFWPDLKVIDLTNTPIARKLSKPVEYQFLFSELLPQNKWLRDGLNYLKTHTNIKRVILDVTNFSEGSSKFIRHFLRHSHSDGAEQVRYSTDQSVLWFLPAHITSFDEIALCHTDGALSRDDSSLDMLARNRITLIPQELRMSHHGIERIDDVVFEQLAAIHPETAIVAIGYNPYLHVLPTTIAALTKLEILDISATTIAHIPDEVALIPSLKTILAWHAPLLARDPDLEERINALREAHELDPIQIFLSAPTAALPPGMAEAAAYVTHLPRKTVPTVHAKAIPVVPAAVLHAQKRLKEIHDAIRGDDGARALTPQERDEIKLLWSVIDYYQGSVGKNKSGE